MHNSDVCGVVVLYYPDSKVRGNITTYASYLDKLYIIDNSDQPSSFLITKLTCETVLLSSGKNRGVAAALNLALEEASKDGYQWMLTMDQDGYFETLELKQLLKCKKASSLNNILLFSPVHKKPKFPKSKDCHYKEVEIVMTSGNLVHIQHAIKIGGYDTRLFIDEVDHEFCLRGKLNGYSVILLLSIYVHHQLGSSYLKNDKQIRLYAPERLYYMMRNYLFIRDKYSMYYSDFFENRTHFLRKFFYQHLRFSSKRSQCLLMLLKGWYDYKLNHFGSIDEKK